MRNHNARFELPLDADEASLARALDAAGDAIEAGTLDETPEDLDAARAVLLDAGRRTHHDRVHRQYRAMAAALAVLDDPGATDTHRWGERLVEFQWS